MEDARKDSLQQWFVQQLERLGGCGKPIPALEPVSGDASFRRYFRGRLAQMSYIAVDAPPSSEDNPSFVRVAELMRLAGVKVPAVLAVDYERGFMLLDDLGDSLYLPELLQSQREGGDGEPARADSLYRSAIKSLLKIQAGVDAARLPPFDRAHLRREMGLFPEWFCGRLLELNLQGDELGLLEKSFEFLADEALGQPVVAVHRDYHSRNLMLLDPGQGDEPGIIDFQDAVAGAYSYDLVSLLRDCYIEWPDERVRSWSLHYFRQAQDLLPNAISEAQFLRDFDLMGLQRHLKVIGIFSRLAIRDNKPGYLADIPLVIRYLLSVARRYDELADFVIWFDRRIAPQAAVKLKPG